MKHKCFLSAILLVAALVPAGVYAGQWRSIHFSSINGESWSYDISDDMRLGFNKENIVVASGNVNVEIPLAGISGWKIKETRVYSGVDTPSYDNTNVFSMSPGSIVVAAGAGEARIFDTDGRLVGVYGEDQRTIDISSFRPGIYIVSVSGKSLKIVVTGNK